MQTTDEDIRRIAFVARRFPELQGLALALSGAGLICVALLARVFALPDNGFFTFVMLPLIFADMAANDVRQAYKYSLGAAIGTIPQNMRAIVPNVLIWIGLSGDYFLIWRHRDGPSGLAILMTVYAVGIVIRDWPRRNHYVIAAAAGGLGTAATVGAPRAATSMSAAGLAIAAPIYGVAYGLIGLALVAVGLLDHRLLASSMKAPQVPADRSGSGAMQRWLATTMMLACAASLSGRSVADDRLTLSFVLATTVGFAALMAIRSVIEARRKLAMLALPSGQRTMIAPLVTLPVGDRSLWLIFGLALAATGDAVLSPVPVPLATCTAVITYRLTAAMARRSVFRLGGPLTSLAGMLVALRTLPSVVAALVMITVLFATITAESGIGSRPRQPNTD